MPASTRTPSFRAAARRVRPILCACLSALVFIGTAIVDSSNARSVQAPGVCDAPPWIADGGQADARFGTVAPAGDVNDDGFDDVIIGAYGFDHPELDEGIVRLYLGTASGLSVDVAWMGECDQAGARMADKLSGAGDVNGDGYDDVIVGAGFYDNGELDEGAAFLYLGSASGLSAAPVWMAEGDQVDAEFGSCSQGAGDVNGDGYDDVIIGAWLYDSGQLNEGKAFVYLGGPGGLGATPAWTGESDSESAVYGYFCTGAGDLNGDGYDDIVVGARRFSGNGLSREGRVYVYYGSATGPSVSPDWVRDGGQAGGELGTSVTGAGDVNGDGFDDLIIGADRYDHPENGEGMAYLFLGSASGLPAEPVWSAEGDQAGASFGCHVDAAGDVNGDGYGDIAVGAWSYDVDALADAGRAYLYLGSPDGPAAIPAWIQDGDQAGGELGDAVRGAGDVNGDGFADLVSGALYRDETLVDEGRAYLFYGCPDASTAVAGGVIPGGFFETSGPNPFATATTLAYSMPEPGWVRLSLHDVTGRMVAELVRRTMGPGRHVVAWDGQARNGYPAATGIYLARLETPRGVRALKLIKSP